MRIGIIGKGYVGDAVAYAFDRTDVIIVDPKHSSTTIEECVFQNPSLIFVCVPTPSSEDGDVDTTIIDSVIEELDVSSYAGLVVIKSTLLPHHLLRYTRNSSLHIVYNPEFLTARTAREDFCNPPFQILGGELPECIDVQMAYDHHSKVRHSPSIKTDLVTASLIKYASNSFYAVKVTFMNELKKIHDNSGADTTWDEFIKILGMNPWIGTQHLKVPGPDGQYGFGGGCLPKDSEAMVAYGKLLGINLSILTQAIEKNKEIRGK